MDRLWSPWRAAHIASSDDEGDAHDDQTLFTRLAESGDDEATLILWRGDTVFVILNRYPYTNGHLMIVPYRAVSDYDALTDDEAVEIARATRHCIGWLRAAFAPHGFNVGMNLGKAAGAGVPDHLHVHVVPRWHGDTNFMTTVAEARVVPEALGETYRRLREVLAAESPEAES